MREDLRALTASFRAQLERRRARGVVGAPDGASPRRATNPTDSATVAPASVEEPLVWQGGLLEAEARPIPRGAEGLRVVRENLGDCQRCKLAPTRQNLVFGTGSPTADLVFVGEGPGREEDEQGEPFVGRAGQLLTKMIAAMGLRREDVYICNVIKCRPPLNRNPEPDEVTACEPFLRMQLQAIGPRLIVSLGNHATQALLRTKTGITALRGKFHRYQGMQVMPTYHPAFLLRSPHMKKSAWEDLQAVMSEMDRLGLPRSQVETSRKR